MLLSIFNLLIFPGFLFSACIGLLAGGIDRIVTARLQWRVGPPWYQNFIDILKLFTKEIIVPKGAKATFLLSPILGLVSVVLAATLLGSAMRYPAAGFGADIIVLIYLLVIPAIAVMIGAFASANPLASIGASREMKLVLGYELPFLLVVITALIKAGTEIKIGAIITHQQAFGATVSSLSGILAFAVGIICMQAKLGLVPFDMSEAEQEIMAGVFIEYSGALLAIFKLTKAVLLYTMPMLLISLFWIDNSGILGIAGKYLLLLVIAILIKNTNPRLRIDQALRFFWGPVTIAAIAALGLALLGV